MPGKAKENSQHNDDEWGEHQSGRVEFFVPFISVLL